MQEIIQFLLFARRNKKKKQKHKNEEVVDRRKQSECKIILLGGPKSGKTTILRHLSLLYGTKFEINEQKLRNRIYIRETMRKVIATVLRNPITFDNPNNKEVVQWIQNHMQDYNLEIYQKIKILWKDSGFKKTVSIIDDLPEYTDYFLDKADEISEESYIPTNEDVLKWQIPSVVDLSEEKLSIENYKVSIVQSSKITKKMLQFFQDLDFIYVVDLNSFDRLEDSLKLFKLIIDFCSSFSTVTVVFNKVDVFKEKISSGNCDLENYFPDFHDVVYHNEPLEVAKVIQFLKSMFMQSVGDKKDRHVEFMEEEICGFSESDIKKFCDIM